jgi:hypothetical protein
MLRSLGTYKRRRMTIALASAVLALLIALTGRHREAVPDAMALLRKADRTEQALAADVALHRTIVLREESTSGSVISKSTVEIWQSGKLHRSSRRMYDAEHRLVAGEWTNPDGTSTVMDRQSAKGRIDASRSLQPNFDNAWRFDPSAGQFAGVVASSAVKLQVEPDAYVFSMQGSDAASNTDGIVTADLRITRSTLHATAAVLVIRQGGQIRTFDYEEVRMERKDLKSVDSSIFLSKREPAPAPHRTTGNRTKQGQLPVTPDLEIAVLYRLAQADADFGEDLTLQALPDGRMQVTGQVENRQRKEEILRALHPLETTSSVKVVLHTVEEAITDNAPVPKIPAAIRVEKLQATSSRIPLDAEIRGNFRERGIPEAQLDQVVERFSSGIVTASLSALQHALGLEAITARFDSQQLSKASVTAKMQWLSIVLHHVEPLYNRTLFLERQLNSLPLVPASASYAFPVDIKDIHDLRSAARRLLNVSILNDQALSSNFSIPLHAAGYTPVEPEHLQGLLSEALSLSSAILTASRQLETRLAEAAPLSFSDRGSNHSTNSYEESRK